MTQIFNWSDARLVGMRNVAPDVREFEIEPVGAPWRAFPPGSHINIAVLIDDLPDHRSYSLVGSGDETYKIAVKRSEKSRGGSRYMWSLTEGARLKVTEPHNHFSLDFGKPDYLLVAGGDRHHADHLDGGDVKAHRPQLPARFRQSRTRRRAFS